MIKSKFLTLTIILLIALIFSSSQSMNVLAADENFSLTGSLHTKLSSEAPLIWQYKANIPHAVYQMSIATSANNNVYLFGGNDWSCMPLTILQIYNPAIDKWMYGTSMPTGRWGSGAAVGPDGNIYVIGGRGVGCGTQSLATVEMYRPSQDTWEMRSPMTAVRNEPGVAAMNGIIYVFGGSTGIDGNVPLASVEAYDPILDAWTTRANMPYPDFALQAVSALNGKIYLFSGLGRTGRVLEYDPSMDTYQDKAPMPTPREIFGAALGSNGKIYVIGGIAASPGSSAAVEAYDPQTNSWSIETSLLTASRLVGVAGVGDSIFAFGGVGTLSSGFEGPLNLVQAAGLVTPLQTPIADFTWSPVDPNIFDTVQFCDGSADPGFIGFNNFLWDFGDGTTTQTDNSCVDHVYALDGDYTVWHQAWTSDGRSAEITLTIPVRTHDVTISKFIVPPNGKVGQTLPVIVGVRNLYYPETVTVRLSKSTPDGYEFVGELSHQLPNRSDRRQNLFIFNYEYTSSDAAQGTIQFYAKASLENARDAQPQDNKAYSSPVTVNY